MKKIADALREYENRSFDIQKLKTDLEILETEHAIKTKNDFGIAEGEVLTLTTMVEAMTKIRDML